MNVVILYDSEARVAGLQVGWGFSALVDQRILFDTGENGEALLENMRILDLQPGQIEAIVISHDHWDHSGGLWEVLRAREGDELPVYICPGFSTETKDRIREAGGRVVECATATEVASGIQTSGEVRGEHRGQEIAEQALILESPRGVSLLTGCAHPGITRLVALVRSKFSDVPFTFAGGGFHLMNSDEKHISGAVQAFEDAQVQRAGPTHCSGDDCVAAFRRAYGESFVELGAGVSLDL